MRVYYLSPANKAFKLLIFLVFTFVPKRKLLKISSLKKSPSGDLGVIWLFRLDSYLKSPCFDPEKNTLRCVI